MTASLNTSSIREMVEKATAGPWEAIDQEREHHHFKFVRAPNAVVKNNRGPSYATEILSDEDYETKSEDMKFIAASRTLVPALCDEVDRLRAAWKFIEDECLDLRCIALPTAGGDADVGWVVVSHHMAKPVEREEGFGKTPLDAIAATIRARKEGE